MFRTMNLLARHRMARKIGRLPGRAKAARRSIEHGSLNAADVGDQLMRPKERAQLVGPLKNAEDRPGKQDEVAAGRRSYRIFDGLVD